MPYNAIKANIAESLNVVVQMERRPGVRFVSEVSQILAYETQAVCPRFAGSLRIINA